MVKRSLHSVKMANLIPKFSPPNPSLSSSILTNKLYTLKSLQYEIVFIQKVYILIQQILFISIEGMYLIDTLKWKKRIGIYEKPFAKKQFYVGEGKKNCAYVLL